MPAHENIDDVKKRSADATSNNLLAKELRHRLLHFFAMVHAHDRGVLIGVALSLLPIFPMVFIGLLIGLINRKLYLAHKLSDYDYILVRKGLWLAAFNFILSLAIVVVIVHYMSVAAQYAHSWGPGLLGFLEGIFERFILFVNFIMGNTDIFQHFKPPMKSV